MKLPARLIGALVATSAAAALNAAAARAGVSGVFAGHTVSGTAIPCMAQPDGVRVCHGTYDNGIAGGDLRLLTFDGTPLEVYVVLPAATGTRADGDYPLVVQSHGWDGPTTGPGDTQFYGPTGDQWARQGYAVLELVARGWGGSCGSQQARLADPAACVNGYIRLDDDRYEVRDIQYAVGLLVDEGIVDPRRIGATGESYGGGVSLQLASLRDRVMLPDGSLVRWRSPAGTPLRLAAAAPVIPWSDLVYSLLPNGRTLDYAISSPTADLSPIGIEKQSFVAGLFTLGAKDGFYAPPGTNPQADLTSWYADINAGEPYDGNGRDEAVVAQIAHYHSAYYLLDGAYGVQPEAPSPLLIANGFTDDLFPVDEALRYYNLERSLYPSDPVALLDGDFGHMRAQNKAGDRQLLSDRIQSFFDYYLKGTGAAPPLGVTATIETCPMGAPSGGPYQATSWEALHPGEVDYSSKPAQTILSNAGDPAVSRAVDPVAGGGACATAPAADQGSGVATYRLPAVTGSGYTLLGSATVRAKLAATGSYPIIAARLWDLDPASATETLVARGAYRLDPTHPDGPQVFQLHPGAWHFAAGHVPKLELLGADSPYLRSSNGQFSIAVSDLSLSLPVHEQPGRRGTPKVVHPAKPPLASTRKCQALPTSTIFKRRVRTSRHGILVFGRARETRCAHARGRWARVRRVYVMIYRPAPQGRCRFLRRDGHLTAPRPCTHPLELLAHGTVRWTLRLRARIPSGRYLVRSDAVDGRHRHQRHTAASVVAIRVR